MTTPPRGKVKAKRRMSAHVAFRADPATLDLLRMVAQREDRTVSQVIREAVRRLTIERLVYGVCE